LFNNIKWGIIAGGAALILSLLVGIFSGVIFLIALLRAGAFMAFFFALGLGCSFVIHNYLPELLRPESVAEDGPTPLKGRRPGSRVNITLGDGVALPDNSDELGDISALLSGDGNPAEEGASNAASRGQGIDQTAQEGYTERGSAVLEELEQDNRGSAGDTDGTETSGPSSGRPAFTVTVGEGDDLGALPDLDAMAGAFLTDAEEESPAEQPAAAFEPSRPVRSHGGAKTQQLDGDFDAKELAAGIRTVLEKAKKG
jgi:hypothetical protein